MAAAARESEQDPHADRPYTRGMEPFALDELEFLAIRERLARATATELGATLAAALQPSADAHEVARRQALTAEAIALLDESLEPPLDGVRDVREQAAHAALGGALSPQALRHVADTAAGRCGRGERSTKQPHPFSASSRRRLIPR